MLRLAKRAGAADATATRNLRVVDDQYCTPSSTADVARAVAFLAATDQYGVYHVTNGGSCTWYQLAKEVFRLRGIDVEVSPITSEEFGGRARRPCYSVLACACYERLGGPEMPPWREAVATYLAKRGK
jgi:dTDP-4-dehydrorhamnose reductase